VSYKERVKVLVVEDEKNIASFVRKGLEERGFVLDVCHRDDEGNELATTQRNDVILLDIMLPGRDGLNILLGLRERNNAVPVIQVNQKPETGNTFDLQPGPHQIKAAR